MKKLCLHPGDRLLDIGSGWGWLIIRAAQLYGVQATGITLSEEQYEKTRQRIRHLGLTHLVNVELKSYLDLDEHQHQFDRIVSVGMYEHVGKQFQQRYFAKINSLLAPGGLSLLHTITDLFEKDKVNSWINKYIFRDGYIPSVREVIWRLPEHNFHLLHAESLRLHYAKTLARWYEKFDQSRAEIEAMFDLRFVRMWELYLKSCEAAFRVSGLDVFQFVFSKGLNNELPDTWQHLY